MTTLEQIIEAARALPPEDRRRLREWIEDQERKAAESQQRQYALTRQTERFQKAMKWIDENRARYLGQWVALDGDQLICHGADARQVHNEAKAAGIKVPFVELVTEEDNSPFCGGWLP